MSEEPSTSGPAYSIGGFRLDPRTWSLTLEGRTAGLGARAVRLLHALMARPEEYVSKAELLETAWPGLVVEEGNLSVQMTSIRRVLASAPGHPIRIETLARRGYRLLAGAAPEVSRAAGPPDAIGGDVPAAPVDVTEIALFGRDHDDASVRQLLANARLVTLMGTGGVGKTQLARRVARIAAADFEHGAAWVDLSPAATRQHLLSCVANATAAQLSDLDSGGVRQLAASLAHRNMLMVLDNSEHLASEVAELSQAILDVAFGVHLLVTSQQILRLPSERVYRLEPLGLPVPGASLADASACASMQLLLDRAIGAERRFRLTAENKNDIVDLLRRLDGLPLAIEMAAPWLPKVGAKIVLDRLSEVHGLLRTPYPGSPSRQQTLRATLEWSYSLLEPAQGRMLRRLSVFVATFRFDLIRPVAADEETSESDVLDCLGALIDRSLVQVAQLEPPRYRLLDTLRTFAAERLQASAETRDTYARHGRAMARLAREMEERFWNMSDRAWLELYSPDYDDLQTAFERACQSRDVDTAAAVAAALQRMDHLRAVTSARRRRAEPLLAMLDQAGLEAKAWIWNSLTSHNMIALEIISRMDAAKHALAAWRVMNDPARLHFALGFYANECARAGEFEAADDALAEAESLVRADWPMRRRMWAASACAGVAIHKGDAKGYRGYCLVELELADRVGAHRAGAAARLKLADAALMAGDYVEAIALGEDAVEQLRELDQPSNLGLALSNLSAALVLSGRRQESILVANEALPLLSRNGWAHLLFDAASLIAAEEGEFRDAARLLGYTDEWYVKHSDQRQPNEETLARLARQIVAVKVGANGYDAWRAEGAALSESDAEALASHRPRMPPTVGTYG